MKDSKLTHSDNISKEKDNDLSLRSMTRGPLLLGIGLIVIFFGAFFIWSALAPLAGAVIAPGQLMPEGTTRVVQHLEGGIVDRIFVKEGDLVTAGQSLIRLKDIKSRALRDELAAHMTSLRIQQKRLSAEQQGAEQWVVKSDFPDDQWTQQVIASEQRMFQLRQKRMQETTDIRQNQITQMQSQIMGLQKQITAQNRQLELTTIEVEGLERLVSKRLAGNLELLAKKRLAATLDESREKNHTEIARLKKQISVTRLMQINDKTQHQEEISNQLLTLQQTINSLSEQLKSAQDVLQRSLVNAPVSGTVVNLNTHSLGGVIPPGAPLMSIVPDNEPLIVKAMVLPTDIDDVSAGQAARVKLSAYTSRGMEALSATVETIAADLIQDETSGISFYTALLKVAPSELARLPEHVTLISGMPVETFITTEPRTLLAYLFEPFSGMMERGLSEP